MGHVSRLVLSVCVAMMIGGAVTSIEAATLPITVMCPGTADTADREYTLTATSEVPPPSTQGDATATCYASGTGNLNDDEFAGWTFIDKDENGINSDGGFTVTGGNSTTGTFGISDATWNTYNELIIGFKVGVGQQDPDWAAFLLKGGITGGNWSVSGRQALSHADLWGRFVTGGGNQPPPDITAVPEPASLLLFGSGLITAATAARRRRSAKQ